MGKRLWFSDVGSFREGQVDQNGNEANDSDSNVVDVSPRVVSNNKAINDGPRSNTKVERGGIGAIRTENVNGTIQNNMFENIGNILRSPCSAFVKEEQVSNGDRSKTFACASCKTHHDSSNKKVGILLSYGTPYSRNDI